MNIRRLLEDRLSSALQAATGLAGPGPPAAMVSPSGRPEFGDYQANGAMAAAKTLKTDPRRLAQAVLEKADLADLAEKVEIAGPGFLNITLKGDWIARQVGALVGDQRLGADRPEPPQRIVVDYSAPNLAKEMHVGHLRSTIIGDALARTLEFLGHTVIRQNHVGDWGTQFGMLVAYLKEDMANKADQELAAGGRRGILVRIEDIEKFYIEAKKRFDSDPDFADQARTIVVQLQTGQPDIRNHWDFIVGESLGHCRKVYERLGSRLTNQDIRGESAYNDDLPKVVADLEAGGLLTESQGAQCVFLPEFPGKDGSPLPLIIQKSDEGYLYATTDLAAIRYRVGQLKADRILYVVDARQTLHFKQVFAVARRAGFAPESVSLEHVAFGTMMGADGRPFKTRAGGTVKLLDLLDEAERRALALVTEKNPQLSDEQRQQIARVVGIGAVKYADLSQNRASDYVFSWEKMLSLEGNTAPYMQYAYARIRSIFRKGGLSESAAGENRLAAAGTAAQRPPATGGAAIALTEPAERALGLRLLQSPEALAATAQECLPNILCSYLYDLAAAFTAFYETCPVLQSGEPLRSSRLALCDLTARTIQTGLGLLGIETVEQM